MQSKRQAKATFNVQKFLKHYDFESHNELELTGDKDTDSQRIIGIIRFWLGVSSAFLHSISDKPTREAVTQFFDSKNLEFLKNIKDPDKAIGIAKGFNVDALNAVIPSSSPKSGLLNRLFDESKEKIEDPFLATIKQNMVGLQKDIETYLKQYPEVRKKLG